MNTYLNKKTEAVKFHSSKGKGKGKGKRNEMTWLRLQYI
jgi:hypothetical protein